MLHDRRSPRRAGVRARGFGVAVLALSALVALTACGQAAQPAATLAPVATAAATPTRAATPAPTAAPAAKQTTGTVSKVDRDGRDLTVKTADGKEILFEISGSRTKIEGSITSRSGLKVGQAVTVTGPEGGEAEKVVVK